MLVTDYTTKIKEIYDTLGSINVTVDEDEMLQICLSGLAHQYGPIQITICTREKPSSFIDLQSMLMVEENHTRTTRNASSDSQMLYTEAGWPLVVVEEVDRLTPMAFEMSRCRKQGTITIKNPPQEGGVILAPGVVRVDRLLVLWQERPQRRQMFEEVGRFR